MAQLTINGITLDPAHDGPTLAAHSLIAGDASKSDFIIVQTRHPLTASEKAKLVAAGAKPLEYVESNGYICRYHPADLATIRALSFVEFANVYMAGFKIAPELHVTEAAQPTPLLALRGLTFAPSTHRSTVNVALHRDVDPAQVLPKIAAKAGVDVSTLNVTGNHVRLRVEHDRLAALAKLDEVRSITRVHEKKFFNNVAIQILGAAAVHTQTQLEGAGQIITVTDTGFDMGSTTNVHPAFHGRVLAVRALGRPTGDDPDGHGTHVCGSALGDGTHTSDGPIRGAAPKAHLVMQSVLDANNGLGGLANLPNVLRDPYVTHGSRIHSNSWGDSQNAYTEDAHDVDKFVWENRDAVVLFAAGNDGSDENSNGVVDAGSIGAPGTAKNCITIGASENHRPGWTLNVSGISISDWGQGWPSQYPVAPLKNDGLADNPEGMAAFSSRGPTFDGRIKPDLVAPGTAILSARSRAPGVGEGWGPSADPLYFYEGGTSMATPLAAGCAAVVREYLGKSGVDKPSAALVKALLINAARDITGQYVPSEAGAIPNNSEGFGRIDLAATVGAIANPGPLQFWDEDTQLDTGEKQTFSWTLTTPANLVKVTLVWTDPAGETLQNDLDLTVKLPNGAKMNGNTHSATTFDRSNNVEQVTFRDVPAGTIEITVKAFRAAVHAQSFALVARAF